MKITCSNDTGTCARRLYYMLAFLGWHNVTSVDFVAFSVQNSDNLALRELI